MQLNPPHQVRVAIYVFTTFGSLVMAYLVAKEIVGMAEVTLWTSFTAAVTAMAGLNVKKPE